MSLLDTASLIVTPNTYKEGKLYSVIPSDGSGDMSVVRATTATRVNSAGLVELVPYNLVQYSEQFDNAAWFKDGATVTANDATAPNGTLTADLMYPSNSGNFKYIAQLHTQGNAIYTSSVYAKAQNKSKIWMYIESSAGVGICYFDLLNGTIQATTLIGSIENVGNGWYRCSVTTASSLSLVSGTGFGVCDALGSTYATANGTDGIYLWGAQLVEGSTALPYQKTETRLNIPRLDYSNGTCPSLLVEPQRTNLFNFSEQLDNAYWSKIGSITITPNNSVSPSGIQNADLATKSGGSARIQRAFTGLTAGTRTLSCFVKAGTGSIFFINTYDGIVDKGAEFNVSTGVVSFVSAGVTATIEDYGNGWYRLSHTYTSAGTSYSCQFYLDSVGTFEVWGFQFEDLSSYQTSYIPTTSASVTRNADGNLTLITPQTLNDFVLFYDGLFFNNDAFMFGSGGNNTWYVNIVPSINRIVIDYASGRKYQAFNGNLVLNQRIKIAIKRASGVFDIFVNGVKLTPGIQVTDTTALSLVSVGWSFLTTFYTQGRINSAAAWQTSLTDAECQTLTTI